MPVSTKLSTAICRPTGLARQECWFLLRGTPAPAIAFVSALALEKDLVNGAYGPDLVDPKAGHATSCRRTEPFRVVVRRGGLDPCGAHKFVRGQPTTLSGGRPRD